MADEPMYPIEFDATQRAEAAKEALDVVCEGLIRYSRENEHAVPPSKKQRKAVHTFFKFLAHPIGLQEIVNVGFNEPYLCPICNIDFWDIVEEHHPQEADTLLDILPRKNVPFMTTKTHGWISTWEHVNETDDPFHQGATVIFKRLSKPME